MIDFKLKFFIFRRKFAGLFCTCFYKLVTHSKYPKVDKFIRDYVWP